MKSINFRSDFSEKLLNISEPHLKSNLIHALHFHSTTQPYYVRVLELQEFKEYVVSNLEGMGNVHGFYKSKQFDPKLNKTTL